MFPYVSQGLTSIHKAYTCILISPFFVYRRELQGLMYRVAPPRGLLSTGILELSTGNPQGAFVGMGIA